jgi:D-glycero-alpha-D-manno-heptose-7-phosphate kinase|tara:strand:- start:12221 stop:13183 length:963 start_codon:yes stop_codon:yes gene_type:complete
MIISKTPFRVSLFGGSTDYESYYSKYGSLLVGFTIDKYCYTMVRKTPKILGYKTRVSYSKVEVLNDNSRIEHNGVRGVLEYLKIKYGVEIAHISDIPSQTGTGSSSSFIVGLLNAFYAIQNKKPTKKELAQEAIYIERKLLNESGGIQDQIWAAYGGINSIDINKEGDFQVKPLPVSSEFIEKFFSRCVLIYMGKTRKSYKIAKSHDCNSKYKENIQKIAHKGYKSFLDQDIDGVATLLNQSWEEKKRVSELVSSDEIDLRYKELKENGVIGGKLLGSGGSGFMFGVLGDGITKSDFKKKYRSNFLDFTVSLNGSEIING